MNGPPIVQAAGNKTNLATGLSFGKRSHDLRAQTNHTTKISSDTEKRGRGWGGEWNAAAGAVRLAGELSCERQHSKGHMAGTVRRGGGSALNNWEMNPSGQRATVLNGTHVQRAVAHVHDRDLADAVAVLLEAHEARRALVRLLPQQERVQHALSRQKQSK